MPESLNHDMPVKKNMALFQLPLIPIYQWRQGTESHPLQKEIIKS